MTRAAVFLLLVLCACKDRSYEDFTLAFARFRLDHVSGSDEGPPASR
jgi:hypothetical protein